GSPAGVLSEDGRAIARKPRRDLVAEGLLDLLRILAFDQTEGDLCGSLRRDHGFRALAGIAADDAVDVAGRTRGYLLDQQAILFAGRDREADWLQERLRREVEVLPLRQNIRRQILHAVVEAGNGDAAVVVEQAAEDVGQHADRVARAAAEH